MKRYLLYLSLGLTTLCAQTLSAEEDYQTITRKHWEMHMQDKDGNDNFKIVDIYQNPADSIINGKQYTPVLCYDKYLDITYSSIRVKNNYDGRDTLYYRQDCDKVFYLPKGEKQEQLVLDFGLQENDVFVNPFGERFVVTDVGNSQGLENSVYTYGKSTPKIISLRSESGKEDIWIEGMGSIHWGIVPVADFSDNQVNLLSTGGRNDHTLDGLFDTNTDSYKFIHFYPSDVRRNWKDERWDFGFTDDTLCIKGVVPLKDFYGPNYFEMMVDENNVISMTEFLSPHHHGSMSDVYTDIDIKIPGFKPGTYIFGTETLVCKGKNPDEDYHPFVEEGKKWECTISWGLIETNTKKEYYSISGDTIVNGITCKKLHGPYSTYAVYEKDGKVYCHEKVNGDFHLLYDFTCHEGDVVNVVNPEGQTEWGLDEYRCTIKKVDTIITKSGHRLKRFTLQAENLEIEFGSEEEYVWIEGVGSPCGKPQVVRRILMPAMSMANSYSSVKTYIMGQESSQFKIQDSRLTIMLLSMI